MLPSPLHITLVLTLARPQVCQAAVLSTQGLRPGMAERSREPLSGPLAGNGSVRLG